jgi:1-pyrroline-5-carboxylate dehydrogenase
MTASNPRTKITYATLRADNEELHAAYEAGLERARAWLGARHGNFIGGEWREGGAGSFLVRSPIDSEVVVGAFARGTAGDARAAISAARAAQPAWAATPWPDRLAIIRRAADLISERQMEYAAGMAIEVGKTRLEALGEVEETADLLRYYALTMERNDGYDHPMDNLGDASVHTRSILRPYGVFAVISPFNFPMALAGGPASAALMAGNTVVLKPSSAAPLSGVALAKAFADAGLPSGCLNLVTGPGASVGQELQQSAGVHGVVFTGSHKVGFELFQGFSTRYPRPCIVEMGGKNPAIVSRTADLDEAAEGIVRSAFGFGGQKCSANSRVYVDRVIHDELVERMVEKTRRLVIGDPLLRETFMGPVIDEASVARYEAAIAEARHDGRVLVGGSRLTGAGMDRGTYVEPAIVGGLPAEHRLFADELFVPITAVCPVDSLDEAVRRSNENLYGLTAGFYGEDPAEVQQFLETIEAGVLYVNRRAGATTGAWPAVQPFGGWKGSGSTGKAGLGMYYVAQFMREQSHTIVD